MLLGLCTQRSVRQKAPQTKTPRRYGAIFQNENQCLLFGIRLFCSRSFSGFVSGVICIRCTGSVSSSTYGSRVFNRQQFQVEDQYRVGRDRRARALCAVSQVARDVEFDLLANMHQLQAFDPTRDHATNRQINRAAALNGAVEHFAIGQLAFVVNSHDVSRLWLRTIGFLDDFVLKAGSGSGDFLTLAVLFEEFLAGSSRLFAHLGQTLFGTLLQGSEGFYQFFILELLRLLAHSIFDALSDGLGIEVVHAFLGQALAHVQADTVGSFLRRGFQLYAGMRVAARKYQAYQGHRRRQPMLFHAISLFMRLKGNRIKPRAYQAATTNGYRHERGKPPISSGVWGILQNPDSLLTSARTRPKRHGPAVTAIMAT